MTNHGDRLRSTRQGATKVEARAAVDRAIVVLDARGSIQGLSEAASAMVGWSAAEAVGQPISALFTQEVEGEPAEAGVSLQAVLRCSAEREVLVVRVRPVMASRVELTITPFEGGGGAPGGAVLLLRPADAPTAETTMEAEDHSAPRRIDHLSRLLRAIRTMNQLIMRERDPHRLIQQACELLVSGHGYTAAWIAHTGAGGELVDWAESGWGERFGQVARGLDAQRWPSCRRYTRASDDGMVVIDPAEHCQTCPLALEYGGHHAVATCLQQNGRDLGMLAVMFPREIEVDDEERTLLLEVATDLAFGLTNIEAERARRQAEESAHRAAVEYRALAEHLPDLIARFDADLRHTYVNPSAARAGTLDASGYVGKRIGETGVAPELAAQREARLREVFATAAAMEVRSTFETPGGPRHFQTDLVPELADDGTVQSVLSLARDVTEQHQSALALQAEKDFVSNLVKTARTIILVLDVEGRIVTFNPYLEELTGRRLAELRGSNWFTTMLPERDQARVEEHFTRAIPGDVLATNTNPIVTADGRERAIEWSNALLRDREGVVIGVLATGTDVTDRLEMEAALKESLRETIALLAASRAMLHEQDAREAVQQIFEIAATHVRARAGYMVLLAADGRPDQILMLGSTEGFRPVAAAYPDGVTGLLAVVAEAEESFVREAVGPVEAPDVMVESVLHAPLRVAGQSVGLIGLADKAGGFTDRDAEMAAAFAEVIAVALREHGTRRALVASEEQHRALFDSSADALVAMEAPSWRFTACNRSALHLFGLEREEQLLGRGPQDFSPPLQEDGRPSAEVAAEHIARALERGSHVFDWLHLRPDGHRFPCTVLLTRLELRGRIALQVTVRDVTEQRRVAAVDAARIALLEYGADRAVTFSDLLRRSLDVVERVTDSRVSFVHFVEPDQKTLTLQAWSTQTVETYCKAEAEGHQYRISQAGVWVDCVRERRAVVHNDYASLEHKRGLPEGHAALERELVVPVFRGGNIVAMLGVGNKEEDYTDGDVSSVSFLADVAWEIAQRKRAEVDREELLANLAQSDRLASMGLLAAGVAHEINNPLSYVLYNLESLLEDFPGKAARGVEDGGKGGAGASGVSGDDALARLEGAVSGTRRIMRIVRGLSTFSRVERTERVPVDVKTSLEHALAMASNELKYRARVVKEYGPVPDVLGSDGKLAQVFLNLLVNAAHAIEEGQAERNEVRVRLFAEGDRVCVEVCDTGRGIVPEHRDSIFDPFFTTKAVGSGSGLGLSICRSILTDFGGALTFTSEVGVGTCFLVSLPRMAPVELEPAPVVAAPSASATSARGRILVIDDEEGIRVIIKRMLGRRHDVVLAESGVVAQEVLKGDRAFDLILCDLMMPKLSGMELHAWLVGVDPALAARLVFVTGGAFTPGASTYLDSVPNLRMEKPFEVGKFVEFANEMVRMAKARKNS